MRAAAQCLADILGQGSDVGALAACHAQSDGKTGLILAQGQTEGVDGDVSGLAFKLDTGSGVLVERAPIFFQSTVHGRDLPQGPGELFYQSRQASRSHINRPDRDRLALGIPSAGFDTQARHRLIGFVCIKLQLAELGRRTKAQGQDAGGQRIKGAGVAGFLGPQQPFGFLQCIIARQAKWLVEQQNPMHGPPAGAYFWAGLAPALFDHM